MEHLDFVIWLIGWAFFIHWNLFYGSGKENKFMGNLQLIVGVIVWLGIAIAIW